MTSSLLFLLSASIQLRAWSFETSNTECFLLFPLKAWLMGTRIFAWAITHIQLEHFQFKCTQYIWLIWAISDKPKLMELQLSIKTLASRELLSEAGWVLDSTEVPKGNLWADCLPLKESSWYSPVPKLHILNTCSSLLKIYRVTLREAHFGCPLVMLLFLTCFKFWSFQYTKLYKIFLKIKDSAPSTAQNSPYLWSTYRQYHKLLWYM